MNSKEKFRLPVALGLPIATGLALLAGDKYIPQNRVQQSAPQVITKTYEPPTAPEGIITPQLPTISPLKTIEVRSPNYTEADRDSVDTIVLHTTEGSGTSALNTFLNPKNEVSAHYLIMENGETYSLVDEGDIAWHCRGFNDRSIGIEIAGHYDEPITQKQVNSTQELIRNILERYNLGANSIKPHSELDPGRRKDPGKVNLSRILQGI